ncbi:SprT family zinc-dependent metalloprotease [Sulfurimonas sp.]|uniref:M48 family metallopeptidase n=1 Tax=Sulfurimonas sp. TaxID=2022749 RepID=UPI002B46A483|nr:SprT family zinc-dependent metalloprotease [Sulfurimonas sp.]
MITNNIKFKDLDIVHVHNKRLKHSYININSDAKVIVKTSSASILYVQDLLLKKEKWIRKQLQSKKETKIIKINLEDEVLLFGEIYSVDASEAEGLRKLLHRLRKPNLDTITRRYDKFYKLYSQIYLKQRVEYFANIMNLKYSEIKYKKMRSRWGSCSSQGIITLNTQLLKLKKKQIDYVVVHELAHLKFMNHSKKFHDLVSQYISDSKNIRHEIRHRQNFTF